MPMRIVVLGAGIVGVHVAAELARRGADVTLVEAAEPGGGTTAGSFAWIDASAPGIADYLELRVLGVRAWRRRSADPWLSRPGTIVWSRDATEQAAHAERLKHLGERVERLDVAAALRHEPDLVIPGHPQRRHARAGPRRAGRLRSDRWGRAQRAEAVSPRPLPNRREVKCPGGRHLQNPGRPTRWRITMGWSRRGSR